MAAIIHPGFGHSGTTSLQDNVFSQRSDLLYRGVPYNELGGIYSAIKYRDEQTYDSTWVYAEMQRLGFGDATSERVLVLSDETFIEQPEIYYTPAMMPVSVIAQRLRELVPDSVILFTLRNQFDYVVSCYFNLKRNYAVLNSRPIESFEEWFDGQFSQDRNLFLRNLDYSRAIAVYAQIFGAESIRVLPIEIAPRHGVRTYLKTLGEQLQIAVDEADVERFSKVRNRRANEFEDDILNLWPDRRFREFWRNLERIVGRDALAPIGRAPAITITLTEQQRENIANRCAKGNRWIESEFGCTLREFGYPQP
jgi:hypothetical protein